MQKELAWQAWLLCLKGLLQKRALDQRLGTWTPVGFPLPWLVREANSASTADVNHMVCAEQPLSFWESGSVCCAGQRLPVETLGAESQGISLLGNTAQVFSKCLAVVWLPERGIWKLAPDFLWSSCCVPFPFAGFAPCSYTLWCEEACLWELIDAESVSPSTSSDLDGFGDPCSCFRPRSRSKVGISGLLSFLNKPC